jgi:hypothetical protein
MNKIIFTYILAFLAAKAKHILAETPGHVQMLATQGGYSVKISRRES